MTKAMTLFLLVLKALMGRSSCRINSEPLKFEKTGCRSQFFPHPSNIKMISSRGISARHREHLICHLSSPLGNFWRNDSSKKSAQNHFFFFKDFQSGLVLGKHCRLWPTAFILPWFRGFHHRVVTYNSSLPLNCGQIVISDPRNFFQMFRYDGCVIFLISLQEDGVGRNAIEVNIRGTDLVRCFQKIIIIRSIISWGFSRCQSVVGFSEFISIQVGDRHFPSLIHNYKSLVGWLRQGVILTVLTRGKREMRDRERKEGDGGGKERGGSFLQLNEKQKK